MKFRDTRKFVPIASLVLWAALSGCRDRQPVAPERSPEPRHLTWGAKTLIGSYRFGVECGVPGTLFPGSNLCGGTTAVYPVAIGPGDHIVTIRLTGKMHVDLSGNCNLGKSEWGPLGSPWAIYPPLYGNWFGIGYSWLTTLPYWHNPSSYRYMPPTFVNADSSVVEYSSVVDGGGEIVMERQQPVTRACNLTGSYDVQIFVQDPVTQTPKLHLDCSPSGSVRRGDSISCVARAEPQGAVRSDMAWVFVDSAAHTISGPTGTDTLWGGRMAVGGVVKVSGKVNGSSSSDSMAVTVSARTWPHLRVDPHERGHGHLPSPAVVSADSEMADTHVEDPVSSPVVEIQTGPNAGWVFLDSIRVVPTGTHLNDAWKPGSVWYLKQHYGVYTDTVTGMVGHYCRQSEIPGVLVLVRRHEGTLPQHNSHIDVFRQWLNRHTPERDLEASVAYLPDLSAQAQSSSDWFQTVWLTLVRDPLITDPKQGHTNQTVLGVVPPALFPCALRW